MSTPSDKTLRLERTKLTSQPPKGRNTTLIMALVAGLAAAALVVVFLKSQQNNTVVQQPGGTPPPVAAPQTMVMTATVDIPAQAPIDRTKFKAVPTDPAKVLPGTITNADTLNNTVASQAIKPNMVITQDMVATASFESKGLSHLIDEFGQGKPGYRAMTINLDPQSSVAGFLLPGDHVDVIGQFDVGQGANGVPRSVTKTVLQNVYLLATGTQVLQTTPPAQSSGLMSNQNNTNPNTPDAASPKPHEIPNATVLVSSSDCERLMIANTKGKLMLVLRGKNDSTVVPVPAIDSSAVTGARVAQAPINSAPPPPPINIKPIPTFGGPSPVQVQPAPPPTNSITVIRGSDKRTDNVPI